jgi:predicted metalloprotease with PDZ domain
MSTSGGPGEWGACRIVLDSLRNAAIDSEIMRRHFAVPLLAAIIVLSSCAGGPRGEVTMEFTVSMPRPATHTFHVSFRCEGLGGEIQDFKMPRWMPGFYRIMDYARNVMNFTARDGSGTALAWEKVTGNTWRVVSGNASTVIVEYDVLGESFFVARNYLDENWAFIAPPGLYMHVSGRLHDPVIVTLEPPREWTQIGTGLDPVDGRPNTFSAPDFDVLYDCPVLMGSQEACHFEVQGVPHRVVLENVAADIDRSKMMDDLRRMVEAATRLMDGIPYEHYTFLMIGRGNGGIEHANSAAISFNGSRLGSGPGYESWLSYVSHEYFHLFNVKRIRPLALGPFDYDTENLTTMLWVSEGLTVYYEDIVMVRAGLMTPERYLEKMAGAITRFERTPGHRHQAATESSLSTWGGSGMGGDRNTTISYYDNGAMLGAMLDLKIRSESGNGKSLDDVMRTLCRKYGLEKRRGFTDAEFRAECEAAAGGPLAEIFGYASTTKDVDYAKYFAYAGLDVRTTARVAAGGYIGLNTRSVAGGLEVSGTTAGSPAARAGLAEGDLLLKIGGEKATAKVLNDQLAAGKPGDRIKVQLSRAGAERGLEIVLGENVIADYEITPLSAPTLLQKEILSDWLRTDSPTGAISRSSLGQGDQRDRPAGWGEIDSFLTTPP